MLEIVAGFDGVCPCGGISPEGGNVLKNVVTRSRQVPSWSCRVMR